MLWQKNKNNKLVEEIKNRWRILKDETKKISEEEIENEKPNQILETFNEILDFNKSGSKTTRFRFKNTNTKPNA